jgi:hypothetical protein
VSLAQRHAERRGAAAADAGVVRLGEIDGGVGHVASLARKR